MEKEVGAKKPSDVWVGIYKDRYGNGQTYRFFISAKRQFDLMEGDGKLISVKKLSRDIAEKVSSHVPISQAIWLGKITYMLNGDTALSLDYYPRSQLKGLRIRRHGLGYYLEAIAVRDLMRQGFKFVRTSSSTIGTRQNQLAKVGFPIDEKVDVRRWLEGMGRGVRAGLAFPPTIREFRERRQPIWVGVYFEKYGIKGFHNYVFHIGVRKEDLPNVLTNHEDVENRAELVAAKTLPLHISRMLRQRLGNIRTGAIGLGRIAYEIKGKCAESIIYSPKSYLDSDNSLTRHSAFGMFLETLALAQLKKKGISKASTTEAPGKSRIDQLHKYGLEPGKYYPLRTWQKAWGQGIREAIEKYGHSNES